MNGKRAKKLRGWAGVKHQEVIYKTWSPPMYGWHEMLKQMVKTAKGIPCVLANCPRKTYQQLKHA